MQLDRRLMMVAGLGAGTAFAGAAHAAGERPGPARAEGRAAGAGELGVRPDSGADETRRLQAAIDTAAERRVPLLLPAGRYLVSGLRLRPGSRLSGAGPATVLQHSGGGPVLSGEGVANVSIEGLAVHGGPHIGDGARGLIELRRATRLAVREVVVEGSPSSGIVLERCSGLVSGCRIGRAAKAGLFSLDAEGGLDISHNHVADCGNNGILVWRSSTGEDGTIVAMNRIERVAARDGGDGQNGNAINVFRAGGVIVQANRIADCAFSAVRANSAPGVQIAANSVARMGEVAIFVEFAFEGAVVAGNLVDRAAVGISVTNFDHGGRLATVQGNLIRNIFVRDVKIDPGGVGIAVEADTAVTGNTIEGAPVAGLQIGWGRYCRDVAATGNVIRASGVGIAVTGDAQAGAVLIANNMITGSRRGAIRQMDHGRPLGPDLADARAGEAAGRIRVHGNMVGA